MQEVGAALGAEEMVGQAQDGAHEAEEVEALLSFFGTGHHAFFLKAAVPPRRRFLNFDTREPQRLPRRKCWSLE